MFDIVTYSRLFNSIPALPLFQPNLHPTCLILLSLHPWVPGLKYPFTLTFFQSKTPMMLVRFCGFMATMLAACPLVACSALYQLFEGTWKLAASAPLTFWEGFNQSTQLFPSASLHHFPQSMLNLFGSCAMELRGVAEKHRPQISSSARSFTAREHKMPLLAFAHALVVRQ